jgi:hypothetical protein
VTFILNEFYHVGFSINKDVHLKLKMKKAMIGDYSMTLSERSQYIYKTSCACTGYFIRRKNWYSVFESEELSEVTSIIKENIQIKYKNGLNSKMQILKNQMLDRVAAISKEVM